jgi:hypothetical protein
VGLAHFRGRDASGKRPEHVRGVRMNASSRLTGRRKEAEATVHQARLPLNLGSYERFFDRDPIFPV